MFISILSIFFSFFILYIYIYIYLGWAGFFLGLGPARSLAPASDPAGQGAHSVITLCSMFY